MYITAFMFYSQQRIETQCMASLRSTLVEENSCNVVCCTHAFNIMGAGFASKDIISDFFPSISLHISYFIYFLSGKSVLM